MALKSFQCIQLAVYCRANRQSGDMKPRLDSNDGRCTLHDMNFSPYTVKTAPKSADFLLAVVRHFHLTKQCAAEKARDTNIKPHKSSSAISNENTANPNKTGP